MTRNKYYMFVSEGNIPDLQKLVSNENESESLKVTVQN